MNVVEFNTIANYNPDRILSKVILESSFTKEIRIAMKAGQKMKEHQSPFPIVIHLLEGEIDFGVNGAYHRIKAGQIFTLEGSVPHDLTALSDSILRLTLSKMDSAKRVKNILK